MNPKLRIVTNNLREPVAIESLLSLRVPQIQRLHEEVFGNDLPSFNTDQLRRRIAYRIQENNEGGLPASARDHALALARNATLRIGTRTTRLHPDAFPHATVTRLVSDHDPRLPMPGSVIVKEHRGRTLIVRVLNDGFEFDGRHFTSLSAVAKDITGTKWNGLAFFGLSKGHPNGR